MENQKRSLGKYVSNEQKEALVDYLQHHLEVARNQFTSEDGKAQLVKNWEELAVTLNALGGANKNASQWKKTWDDLRTRTKEKFTKIKKILNKSGINGTDPVPKLKDLEERIISIISIDAVDGDGSTLEIGCNDIVTEISDAYPYLRPNVLENVVEETSFPDRSDISKTPTNNPPVCSSYRKRKELPVDVEKKYLNECLDLKRQKINILKENLNATNQIVAELKSIKNILKRDCGCKCKCSNDIMMNVEYLQDSENE